MNKIILLVAFSLITTYGKCQVSMKSLLEEMVSRESLAKFPSPDFKLLQFSSYDRMSISPDKPGWFANYDLSNFLRIEMTDGRREFVLFDHQGPGAVVRFWMTFAGINPGEGVMRIYIDGSDIPAVQGSPFELISGGVLAPSPLSSSVPESFRYDRRGHNLYLPIPYASGCKITYESEHVKEQDAGFGGENVYYNINYREYPKGTVVESFSTELLRVNANHINKTAEILSATDNRKFTENEVSTTSLIIEKGEEYIETLSGERAISQISLRLENPGSPNFDLNQALRSVIIEVWFDGNKTVWSPVGDFFGTGYIISPHTTFFTDVDSTGTLTSLWIMPFRENARFVIRNLAGFPVKLFFGVSDTEWEWDERSMYFGCSWREYNRIDAGGVKSNAEFGEGAFDVNYVTLRGKGVFAGDALTLFNSAYAWWGEGDEKIYVDGENFPSHFGTGTEDYYGYAWCRPEKFTDHPFVSQPDGSGNLEAGYTVNLRYRSLDKIPFNTSLVLDMEVWTWTDAILNYAPVTFYYLHPDNALNQEPVKDKYSAVLMDVVTDRLQLVPANIKPDRTEFDQLDFYYRSAGRISLDRSVGFTTSNKAFVNWSGASANDTLIVKFYNDSNIENANIVFGFVKGLNFGKFQLLLNGKPIGEPFDGYSEQPFVSEVHFGTHPLKSGENRFVFINLGNSNPTRQNSFAGIDYIEITK